MKLFRTSLVVLVALAALALSPVRGAASGDRTTALVNGHGRGVLTDPDGNEFRLRHYGVFGAVRRDGSAKGSIHFLWRGSFPEVWGDPVCEGTCDTITLTGRIESGSVAADGTLTLSGTAREVDWRRGKVVFDSGFDEPFSVVAGGRLGRNEFILQWCLLPEFSIEGPIGVRLEDRGDDDDDDGRQTASAKGPALMASPLAASSVGRSACA
jgi:hypothetical protein